MFCDRNLTCSKITSSYGFEAFLLVESSWRCQKWNIDTIYPLDSPGILRVSSHMNQLHLWNFPDVKKRPVETHLKTLLYWSLQSFNNNPRNYKQSIVTYPCGNWCALGAKYIESNIAWQWFHSTKQLSHTEWRKEFASWTRFNITDHCLQRGAIH